MALRCRLVPTLSRNHYGVWTLEMEDDERDGRSEAHDEALPRYLNAFDPAFIRAEEVCEAEFVKALIRVRSMQDPGWDPYETTLRAIPAMIDLQEQAPEDWQGFETARHLQLWTYGHIIEASEPHAILGDMLDIAHGGFFKPFRFPEKRVRRPRADELFPPTRPQFFREKLPELERLAEGAGMHGVLDPLREVWEYDLRNAVFHADYSLYGGEVRTRRTTYSHDEIQTLVNRAIAYHEAVALLVKENRRGYQEPTTIVVHPEQATEPGESATVMVREGVGAIGLKHAYTAEEIAEGAIAWHMARMYPDEAAALQADPTLAHFPARPEN